MQFRIAVSDPLPVFRRGVMAILRDAGFDAEAPSDVVAWVRDEQQAVVLHTVAAAEDWAVLDRMRRARSGILVIAVLSVPTVDAHVRALRAGAICVIARDASPRGLADALAAALEGRSVLPVEVVQALVRGTPATSPPAASPEEIEWLGQLAAGSTVGALAATAGYSERTMFRLLSELYRRLGVDGRVQALLRARDEGWID